MPQSLEQLIAEHKQQPGALLVIAEKLMQRYHAIPPRALDILQQQLQLGRTQIQSVLSFYHYPVTENPIRCTVEVCTALSCHLLQADQMLKKLCEEFAVEPEHISEDGRLLITRINCLSECERAPAVHINGKCVPTADLQWVMQRIREVMA